MKTLYLTSHANDVNDIELSITELPMPLLNKNECLIKVASSGINPSDTLATIGYFNDAVLPRVPGRDFAGTVVAGPSELLGQQVWGTGGAAGINYNGTHAEYIKLSAQEIALIPNNLDLITAGAQPLPYITAYYSLVKRAHIKAGDTILVVGALGQVGSAAMSIANWKDCKAIALVRGKDELQQARQLGWLAINSEEDNLYEQILAANNGLPIQVILNSVGNMYWQAFTKVLAESGSIVTISARENAREATINLFELYRANQTIIGINTVLLDFAANAQMLSELKVGFEQNKLAPLTVATAMVFTPEHANLAYKTVLQGAAGRRVVLQFN